MGIRSAVFDEWVMGQMRDMQDAVVIHIGCGMDSRVLRTENKNHRWYDIDFPDVIAERKRYYLETENYHMIAGDARDCCWLENIPGNTRAVVVMEGVSMYLTLEELGALTEKLCAHFEKLAVLMDCYTTMAAKFSKYKNPINEVGVTEVYGIDQPLQLQRGDFVFEKELEMTPDRYVNELQGVEKLIFRKLYGGSFSKKLYRLLEYRKG